MKIGAVTLAYNDEGTIAGTIKCLQPFVDQHVVLISEKPYFGEAAEPDRTEEICEDLDVSVVKGVWELDHFQRNVGNRILSHCDWVLGFDSDEMMTRKELETFINFLETTDAQAVSIQPIVYWHDTNYILDPIPEYTPIIAMRPNVRFTHIRNIDVPHVKYNGDMHHLSWCSPKDIYKKVTNYAHATDFDGKAWYNQHYKTWKPNQPAVLPDKIYQVIKKPLPKELNEYLGCYTCLHK